MGVKRNTRARVSSRWNTISKSYQNDDFIQLFASDDKGSGIDLPESDPSVADKIIHQCDYQIFDNKSQPGPSTTRGISLKSRLGETLNNKKQNTNKDEDWRNKVDFM